jgi:hypothetical protein
MPRFSLKRLLAGITLVAVGLGVASLAPWIETGYPVHSENAAIGAWLVGGAVAGAGAFYPFKRLWLGALTGFIIQIAHVFWALSYFKT